MEPTSNRSTDTIERASTSMHDTIDRVSQTASAYAERFGEQADALMQMKDDWVEGAREYVREHPIAALGIAVGVGYVLSMLMRSRD